MISFVEHLFFPGVLHKVLESAVKLQTLPGISLSVSSSETEAQHEALSLHTTRYSYELPSYIYCSMDTSQSIMPRFCQFSTLASIDTN